MFENVRDWVDEFNGKNFEFWKEQIEDYLCVTDLKLPLSGVKPTSMDDAEWRVLDRMALRTIRSTLSKSIAFETANENTAAGLMATLTDVHELKPTVINQVHLLRELFKLKMAEGASAVEHLGKFSAIINQLSSMNIHFDEGTKALMILSSLPDGWNVFEIVATLSAGKNKLMYDDVRGLVLAEESRRRELSGTTNNNDLGSRERGFDSRGSSKSRNHMQLMEATS